MNDIERRRENARHTDGTFGEHERSEPELALTVTDDSVTYHERDVEYGSDEKPYPALRGKDRIESVCIKCGGSGVYDAPSQITFYTSAVSDVTTGCFACYGTGTTSAKVSSIRARVRRNVKEDAAREAQNAAFQQKMKAWEDAGHNVLLIELGTALDEINEYNPYRHAIRNGYEKVNHYDVTAEDAAAARQAIQDAREYDNRPSTLPEGRQTVRGTFLSYKRQESQWGTSMKMLVEVEGGKVWGTYPSNLFCQPGDEIEFTANFSHSDNDPAFGLFARPTKARNLTANA